MSRLFCDYWAADSGPKKSTLQQVVYFPKLRGSEIINFLEKFLKVSLTNKLIKLQGVFFTGTPLKS